MKLDRVNYLNIFFMIASAIAAFIIPFKLFLLSYAILGPLHYLTEISWLHDRKYFTVKKQDTLVIVFLGILLTIGDFRIGVFKDITHDLTFLIFGLALTFAVTKTIKTRIFAAILLLVATFLFHSNRLHYIIFSVYLPSVIHVYIFTGAFILYGALKSKSFSGMISFIVFIFCALSCLTIIPTDAQVVVPNSVETNYRSFRYVNFLLTQTFGYDNLPNLKAVFSSEAGQSVARFLAFAYTYHYLNWFSKTSIIQWHKVPKARFIGILLIWVASLLLYYHDYILGLKWLFILSHLHVVLEFPLNHLSFIGIGQEIKKRLKTVPVQN